MKRDIDFRLLFILLMAAFIMFLMTPLYAGDNNGKRTRTDIELDSDVSVSNPVSVRDTSRAVGLAGGDVDINDCYRSWSVIVYQGSMVNKLCLAQQLVLEGNYQAAAELRCSVKSVRRAFGGGEKCVFALSVPPPEPVTSSELPLVEDHFEEEEEYHEEQQELYADLEAKIQNLEAERRAAARRSQQQQQQQQEYAQETLQRLEKWK